MFSKKNFHNHAIYRLQPIYTNKKTISKASKIFFKKGLPIQKLNIPLRCTTKLIQYFCSTQKATTLNLKEENAMFNKTFINKRIFTRPIRIELRNKRYIF